MRNFAAIFKDTKKRGKKLRVTNGGVWLKGMAYICVPLRKTLNGDEWLRWNRDIGTTRFSAMY
jgi:uncharacterized protein YjdB